MVSISCAIPSSLRGKNSKEKQGRSSFRAWAIFMARLG